MSEKEIIQYIESIGFKHDRYIDFYHYKEFKITFSILNDYYSFYNGEYSNWFKFSELYPLEVCFKKELRRIKLKQLFS